MARRKLSQTMADAVSTAIEFEHGREVIAKYNTIRALSCMGLVRVEKESAILTAKGIEVQSWLRRETITLQQVNKFYL